METKKIAEKIEIASIILSVATIIQHFFISFEREENRKFFLTDLFLNELSFLALIAIIIILVGVITLIFRKLGGIKIIISGIVLFIISGLLYAIYLTPCCPII